METSRAVSGSAAVPEEEAASFIFLEAIDAGLRGKIPRIWGRSRLEEKGDLEQGKGRQ
jgi:hypothetical protein